jgi:hypothetical protein
MCFQTVFARGPRKEGTTKFIPPTQFMGANLKIWSKKNCMWINLVISWRAVSTGLTIP